ncbi:hypothetical protein OTU49_011866, partial [Cherax quadricarinatus]
MEQGTDHLTGKGRETTKVKSSGTPTRLHREFLPSISRNEVKKKMTCPEKSKEVDVANKTEVMKKKRGGEENPDIIAITEMKIYGIINVIFPKGYHIVKERENTVLL